MGPDVDRGRRRVGGGYAGLLPQFHSINGGGGGLAMIMGGGLAHNIDGFFLLDGLWSLLAVITLAAAGLAGARLVPRREA